MINQLPGEIWKDVDFGEHPPKLKYAVSNFGRVLSFHQKHDDGKIIKGKNMTGFRVVDCTANGKRTGHLVHRWVAKYFCDQPSDNHSWVIHLDYNKGNNKCNNLRWVDKAEWEAHQDMNPKVQRARANQANKPKPTKGHKLTADVVAIIKKKIFDPNRKTRLKMIAKQYGISEMQLYRIKNGENWSHVSPAA